MERASVGPVRLAWARARGDDDRQRGRTLLLSLVTEISGALPPDVVITAVCPDCGGSHGRPTLERPTGLHLSVAHCSAGTVVAVATAPVGVDLELTAGDPTRLTAIEKVAGASPDPLRHWTRIEAVLKADGRGLRVDPREVRVADDTAQLSGSRYLLFAPQLEPGWVVSVAVAAEAPERED